MSIGHYAVGFAAKNMGPLKTSLGLLFAAAVWLDIVYLANLRHAGFGAFQYRPRNHENVAL